MSTGDKFDTLTAATTNTPYTTTTPYYYRDYGYYTWPVYTTPLTEDDVRRVIREELEEILVDGAIKKATIRALKKRLAELDAE